MQRKGMVNIMKIILDAMSGDNAPLEIIKGAIEAAEEYPVDIILTGDDTVIRSIANDNALDIDRPNISIVRSSQVINMEDPALSVIREKNDSSMAVGLKMLAEGKGDAFVSAGNTGALHAGSTLIVRRIKGVKKSAIATIMPFKKPTMLIDSGANIELTNESYLQFAQMGSIYMSKIFGIENPEVGLLNIGSERTKGTKQLVEVYDMLEAAPDINFVGNIEGKDIPYGKCDVIVTDGFTGNIVLKFTEGCGGYLLGKLKEMFMSNVVSKLSALAVRNGLKKMKHDFDASDYGGAPLLGLSKPVIKAHGSSDARAIKNAVRQAIGCAETNMSYEIALKIIPDMVEKPADPQPAADKTEETAGDTADTQE